MGVQLVLHQSLHQVLQIGGRCVISSVDVLSSLDFMASSKHVAAPEPASLPGDAAPQPEVASRLLEFTVASCHTLLQRGLTSQISQLKMCVAKEKYENQKSPG